MEVSLNEERPVRIAVLGGSGTGKSSLVSLLTVGITQDVHYPTRKHSGWLFTYQPTKLISRKMLDESYIAKSPQLTPLVVLSPFVFHSMLSGKKSHKNPLYKYDEGQASPIYVDIIDTPAFKPEMIVPFLEYSLFRNLDKEDLRNLADVPRQPVSTRSLLTASGASELNGKIDGYILCYSAVPCMNPPEYSSEPMTPVASNERRQSYADASEDGGFSLLTMIRETILDAWREYRTFERKWKQGSEGDIYSLMYSLKSLMKKPKVDRTITPVLDVLQMDPRSKDAPPPLIICATHCNHEMKSDMLIEQGKELAIQWGCGFVGIDCNNKYGVDEIMGMMVREVLEREKVLNK